MKKVEVVDCGGDDAVHMARTISRSMTFIDSMDGISHNKIEDAKPEQITAGTQRAAARDAGAGWGGRVVGTSCELPQMPAFV